jgi:AcrR family transcriptional regulator
MTEPGSPQRLSDKDIGDALTRLNDLLEEVEQIPGPAGEIAVEAVSALARVYGEALARAIGHVAGNRAAREAFLNDELLGHLLVLHELQPESVDRRVSRAITKLSGPLDDQGARVELAAIEDGVATLRLVAHGCGSAGIADVVREAVLAAAPELSEVRVVSGGAHDSAFVPLEKLMSRPVTDGART